MTSSTMSHGIYPSSAFKNAVGNNAGERLNFTSNPLLASKRSASSAGKELPKGTAGRYRFIGDAEFQSLTPSPHPLTPPSKQNRFASQQQPTTGGRQSRSSLSDENVSLRASAERQLPSLSGEAGQSNSHVNGAKPRTPQQPHASPDSLESGGIVVGHASGKLSRRAGGLTESVAWQVETVGATSDSRSSITPQPPPRQLSTRKSVADERQEITNEPVKFTSTSAVSNAREKSRSPPVQVKLTIDGGQVAFEAERPAGVQQTIQQSDYEERAIDVGSLEITQRSEDEPDSTSHMPATVSHHGTPHLGKQIGSAVAFADDEAPSSAVTEVKSSMIAASEPRSATLNATSSLFKPVPVASFEHVDIQIRREKPSPSTVGVKRSETCRYSARPGIIQRVKSIFGRSVQSPPPSLALQRTYAISNLRRRSSCTVPSAGVPTSSQQPAKPYHVSPAEASGKSNSSLQEGFVDIQRHIAALTGSEMIACTPPPITSPGSPGVFEVQSIHSLLSSPTSVSNYQSTLVSPTATIGTITGRRGGKPKHETFIVAFTITTKSKTHLQLPSPLSLTASHPPTMQVQDSQRLDAGVARSVSEHMSLSSQAISTVRSETNAAEPLVVAGNPDDAELCELDFPTYAVTPQMQNYSSSTNSPTTSTSPKAENLKTVSENDMQPVVKMRPKMVSTAMGKEANLSLTAAIHFGETYCSAGFSHQSQVGGISQRHDDILAHYPCSDPLNSRQCLSAVLFDKKSHKMHQFGYQARNTWLGLPPKTRKRFSYVRDFGQLLKPTQSPSLDEKLDYWIAAVSSADADDTTFLADRISACEVFTEAISYFKKRIEQRIKDQSTPSSSPFYSTSHLAVDTKNVYTSYAGISPLQNKSSSRKLFGSIPENETDAAGAATGASNKTTHSNLLWVISVRASTPRRVVEAAARAAGCTNFTVCCADDVSAAHIARAIQNLNLPPLTGVSAPWRRWSRTSSILTLYQAMVAANPPQELLSRNYFITMRCGGTSTTVVLYRVNDADGIITPLAQREHRIGSRCINAAFFALLRDLFGAECMAEYERTQPVGYNDLTVAVENRKRFVRPDDSIKLPLPCTFEQFYERNVVAGLLENDVDRQHRSMSDAAREKGYKFSLGLLELPPQRLRSWFDPVCHQIAEALIDDADEFHDLINSYDGADTDFRSKSPLSMLSNGRSGEKGNNISDGPRMIVPVVLYGGFAESVLLKNYVSSTLLESPRSRNLKFALQLVNVFVEPSLVPLHGALSHRLPAIVEQPVTNGGGEQQAKLFRVLRSRYTIGIGVMKPFDDASDPTRKLVVKNGRKWCRDCFEILFTRNEAFTQYPQEVRRLFSPAMNSQENAVVKLYISAHIRPRYVDEPEVRHVATLRVNFNPATPKLINRNPAALSSFAAPEFDVMSVKSSNNINSPKMLTTVTASSPSNTTGVSTPTNTNITNAKKRLSSTFSTKSTVITTANVVSPAEARRHNSKSASATGENVRVYIRLTINSGSLEVVVEDATGATMAQCSVAQWMVN